VSRERPTQPPRECGSPDSSRCLPRARLVLFVRASRPARGSPLPLLYNHLDNNITGSLSPPDGTHRRSNDHRSASERILHLLLPPVAAARSLALSSLPQKWELSAHYSTKISALAKIAIDAHRTHTLLACPACGNVRVMPFRADLFGPGPR
jgi:hypothetical protein